MNRFETVWDLCLYNFLQNWTAEFWLPGVGNHETFNNFSATGRGCPLENVEVGKGGVGRSLTYPWCHVARVVDSVVLAILQLMFWIPLQVCFACVGHYLADSKLI